MERLEAKKIHGNTYYYYSHWEWVNGKCRRVWQKYLGKLEDIVKAVDGNGPPPKHALVFQWGLPNALLKECNRAEIIKKTDELCAKRNQGLSVGEYLALASLNRAIRPTSKRSFWEWFTTTSLMRAFPHASQLSLSSQRFWDHMDKINEETSQKIWTSIITDVLQREAIDISQLNYDGTNFYTFIDTFTSDCELPQRGKNKQGRSNLRQISYALFCSVDNHIPLYFSVYEGNRHDAKQFPLMIQRFSTFFQQQLGGQHCPSPTIIFDKGNNSTVNFCLLDSLHLDFVGAVKLHEHNELAQIANNDKRMKKCVDPRLQGVKAFRVRKKIYGRERIVIVTYSDSFFYSQYQTLHGDITRAIEKLSNLRQKLQDRAQEVIKRGKKPTIKTVQQKCLVILRRPYLKEIIRFSIKRGSSRTGGIPQLSFYVDTDVLQRIADTYLGKHILISSKEEWTNAQIILAYRSQYLIEDVFKEMKDRKRGQWWPLFHWTDSKIKVHGLYCSIAVLLRALLMRRLHQAGMMISLNRTFDALDDIREIVNVFPKKRKQKKERTQTVLTELSELQKELLKHLDIEYKNLTF